MHTVRRLKYVLFVCNPNAGRSQMAQALFERHAPADVRAESAGSTPGEQVWPNVIEAMREIGSARTRKGASAYTPRPVADL